MNVNQKTVVVTGGARGIGKAMALRFAEEGARVVVADRLQNEVNETAIQVDGLAVVCDVEKEHDIQQLVSEAEAKFGAIDLFCSNAGVSFGEAGGVTSATNDQWQTCWNIHVMAHVYAARAALPGMIARGRGYFLQMVSAAGILNQIGDAAFPRPSMPPWDLLNHWRLPMVETVLRCRRFVRSMLQRRCWDMAKAMTSAARRV